MNKKIKIDIKNSNYPECIMGEMGILVTYVYVSRNPSNPWWLVILFILMLLVRIFSGNTDKIFSTKIKTSKWINFSFYLIIFISVCEYRQIGSSWIQVFSNKDISAGIDALTTAICEEFLFRILFYKMFLKIFADMKYFLLWAAVCSTLMFSLIHLFNLSHQAFEVTFQQLFSTFGWGMIYCAIYLYNNRIFIPILMHFLWDLRPNIHTANNPLSSWTDVILSFLLNTMLACAYIYFYNRYINSKCSIRKNYFFERL